MRFYKKIFIILILLVLQEKSFSYARREKKETVAVVTPEKELAVGADGNFSLQKEIPLNAKVETSENIGGRKMSVEAMKKESKSKKASMASNGRRKGDEENKWKDTFMAFSADYRSPKPHPPKNN